MAIKVNNPNSQNDVLTTMGHALLNFQSLVATEMPNIPVVYTEDLSYESAIKQLLANNNFSGSTTSLLPFFAYNRTVLREVEDKGLGRRAKNCTNHIQIGPDLLEYSVAYGEFDIQFLYASNNIELTEKFEVVYNSEEGITGSKELTVDMAELGLFKYFLQYNDLGEKQIEHEDQYFKGIIGSIVLRGFYFTFRGKAGLINSINQRIISTSNVPGKVVEEILSSVTIL